MLPLTTFHIKAFNLQNDQYKLHSLHFKVVPFHLNHQGK